MTYFITFELVKQKTMIKYYIPTQFWNAIRMERTLTQITHNTQLIKNHKIS